MTERSVKHASFTLERTYTAQRARVYAAWAEEEMKRRWFGAPDQPAVHFAQDFRVGGHEINRGAAPNGHVYSFDALYQDIIPEERIVYTYEMYLDDQRISVSLATIEFAVVSGGTRLTLTEQGVFLDGLDDPADREHGTRELLDKLGRLVHA